MASSLATRSISIRSLVPSDPVRRKTATLLQSPTLEELRAGEYTDEPLKFIWRIFGQRDEVEVPVYVDSVDASGDYGIVRGQTGRHGSSYCFNIEVAYRAGFPSEFRYMSRR